jgi:hypothetical protein
MSNHARDGWLPGVDMNTHQESTRRTLAEQSLHRYMKGCCDKPEVHHVHGSVWISEVLDTLDRSNFGAGLKGMGYL